MAFVCTIIVGWLVLMHMYDYVLQWMLLIQSVYLSVSCSLMEGRNGCYCMVLEVCTSLSIQLGY
jgi:hypothetical protein